MARLTATQLFGQPCVFVTSVVQLERLPKERVAEIAFAGRSNVGKSSLLNALVGHKGLAKTSNTPGRTQSLNFFRLGETHLVDMPGHGYAKAAKTSVRAWTQLVHDYVRGRSQLKRVMLLVDARHGLKDNDRAFMDLLDQAAVSHQLVLTKADKVTPAVRDACLAATQDMLSRHPAAFPEIVVTSSVTGEGLAALRDAVARGLST